MNLKNKILLTIIAIIFAICLFNTNCFCSSINIESETYNTSFIDSYDNPIQGVKDLIDNNQDTFNFTSNLLPKYIFIYKSTSNAYFIYTSSCPMTFTSNVNGTYNVRCPNYDVDSDFVYNFCIKSNGFTAFYDGNLQSELSSSYTSTSSIEGDIISSNYDIYNNVDELVFQAPVEETKTILTPVIQEQETTLQEVMKQILEILPIVMIVVVSYLALRKALKMLSTFLRNS